jgi:uncharacterized membrane protein YfcA
MWLILGIGMLALALVSSMLGQGGGSLYTPLQVWLGIPFHRAAATSLFLIIVTSFSASLVFSKAKKIDWSLAIALESVTAAGAFAGGLESDRFSAATLTIVFAVVIGLAGIFMMRPMKQRTASPVRAGGFFAWRRTTGGKTYFVNMAFALPASFLAGVISGMIGVGGGLIKVPLMVLVLGVPMDIAVGSSALMVGLTAGGGFTGHLLRGHWDWRLSLVLAAAVFLGGQIGSRITVKLDESKLQKGLGWFLLVLAATMVFRVVR